MFSVYKMMWESRTLTFEVEGPNDTIFKISGKILEIDEISPHTSGVGLLVDVGNSTTVYIVAEQIISVNYEEEGNE